MVEAKFKAAVAARLRGLGNLVLSVENTAASGMFDLYMVRPSITQGKAPSLPWWIEIKVRRPALRPSQMLFWRAHTRSGYGRICVICRISRNEIRVYRNPEAARRVGGYWLLQEPCAVLSSLAELS